MLTNERLNNINKNLEEHLGLFSDAEMERDQKTYCTFRPSELHYMKEAIEELLQLRELRDAGDDMVRQLEEDCFNGADHCGVSTDAVRELARVAITRGRTRTDAVNKAAEWAKECEALEEEVERLNQIIRELKDNFGEMEAGA